jgi:hypothetical protein
METTKIPNTKLYLFACIIIALITAFAVVQFIEFRVKSELKAVKKQALRRGFESGWGARDLRFKIEADSIEQMQKTGKYGFN